MKSYWPNSPEHAGLSSEELKEDDVSDQFP